MSLIICVLLSALGGILSPYLVFELFTGWPPGTELAIFSQCLGSYGKRLYTEPVPFRLWMYLITDEQARSTLAHQDCTVSSLAREPPITVLGLWRDCLRPSVPLESGDAGAGVPPGIPSNSGVVTLRQLFPLQGKKAFWCLLEKDEDFSLIFLMGQNSLKSITRVKWTSKRSPCTKHSYLPGRSFNLHLQKMERHYCPVAVWFS